MGTGIADKELRRTLQSLACAKVRVLRKRPKSAAINDGDTFYFKRDFKHSYYRIKINTVQMREKPGESKATHARVFRDRQHTVDAALVRIMKTRKSLPHTRLLSECLMMLRFPCEISDVKRRIDNLIEREYMERDEENNNLYHYIA